MQTGLLMDGTRPVPIALRTFRDAVIHSFLP